MIELLSYPNAVDLDGNVVHVHDLEGDSHRHPEELDQLPLFPTGPIDSETLAIDSLTGTLTSRAADRLDSMAHHPAMSAGESAELAGSVKLGEAAQIALDTYREAAYRFKSAKGHHYRELMINLVRGQKRGGDISSEEVNAIIALVSPAVTVQTSVKYNSGNSRPRYDSPQDAAANNRTDED